MSESNYFDLCPDETVQTIIEIHLSVINLARIRATCRRFKVIVDNIAEERLLPNTIKRSLWMLLGGRSNDDYRTSSLCFDNGFASTKIQQDEPCLERVPKIFRAKDTRLVHPQCNFTPSLMSHLGGDAYYVISKDIYWRGKKPPGPAPQRGVLSLTLYFVGAIHGTCSPTRSNYDEVYQLWEKVDALELDLVSLNMRMTVHAGFNWPGTRDQSSSIAIDVRDVVRFMNDTICEQKEALTFEIEDFTLELHAIGGMTDAELELLQEFGSYDCERNSFYIRDWRLLEPRLEVVVSCGTYYFVMYTRIMTIKLDHGITCSSPNTKNLFASSLSKAGRWA